MSMRPQRVPSSLPHVLRTRTEETVKLHDSYTGQSWTEQRVNFPVTQDEDRAVLVSSELSDSSEFRMSWTGSRAWTVYHEHAPILDLDFPCHVVESSTPGHSHLYIDKRMSWWKYRRLLKALWKAGLIEEGYYRASVQRGATHLRHPRMTKDDV